jgi:NitT/TauT family transport system substrate-binding protein
MTTTTPRRRGIAALAAGLALSLTAACSSGEDTAGTDAAGGGGGETLEVDFGYIGDYNGASLLAIAEDQGIWEEHGLDVTTSVFTNGPLQIQALGTCDLDFGYIGPGAFWLPASGQAKIMAINTLGEADRVIAQPDSGIESVEDLVGKTVGVPQGTSGDMILTLALEDAGLSKDDVEVVNMDPATLVPAFSSGQIDAAGFWYPAIATIKEQVPDLVELAQNTDFADTLSFPTAFVAGNDVVADEPEKVERVAAALKEAMQYRSENPEETIQLTADLLQLDPAQVEGDAQNVQVLDVAELESLTEDGTVAGWLEGMNEFFVDAGQLPGPVDPASYYLGEQFVAAGR